MSTRSTAFVVANSIANTIIVASLMTACSAVPSRFNSESRRFASLPALADATDATDARSTPRIPTDINIDLSSALTFSRLRSWVLVRNPSLETARQGWRAALARVESSSAIADPMIGFQVAPLSFVSEQTRIGFAVEISQELPWPGKRRLRAQIALAESEARSQDIRRVRLQLSRLAATLLADYSFAERALQINASHLELLNELGRTVEFYLETGKTWQEEALKVDVEIAMRRRQRLGIESRRDIIKAQINSLLHRDIDAPLPLPSPLAEITGTPIAIPPPAVLAARALERRPELAAVNHRLDAADAAVDAANKDYLPDFKIIGTYNRMWPVIEHQFMVGVAIGIPLQRGQRDAALDGARATWAQRAASRRELLDRIILEVTTARRQLIDADASARLLAESLLPAARNRVAATRMGLDAGRTSFLEVIRAESELRDAELEFATTIANTERFRAELAWTLGQDVDELNLRANSASLKSVSILKHNPSPHLKQGTSHGTINKTN